MSTATGHWPVIVWTVLLAALHITKADQTLPAAYSYSGHAQCVLRKEIRLTPTAHRSTATTRSAERHCASRYLLDNVQLGEGSLGPCCAVQGCARLSTWPSDVLSHQDLRPRAEKALACHPYAPARASAAGLHARQWTDLRPAFSSAGQACLPSERKREQPRCCRAGRL